MSCATLVPGCRPRTSWIVSPNPCRAPMARKSSGDGPSSRPSSAATAISAQPACLCTARPISLTSRALAPGPPRLRRKRSRRSTEPSMETSWGNSQTCRPGRCSSSSSWANRAPASEGGSCTSSGPSLGGAARFCAGSGTEPRGSTSAARPASAASSRTAEERRRELAVDQCRALATNWRLRGAPSQASAKHSWSSISSNIWADNSARTPLRRNRTSRNRRLKSSSPRCLNTARTK
mmetsp:Transcript_66055/g.178575  ORF Transcript_66055/g.178575 Transcript_66055/m.178575 type:complete len:236 (+) Transcript_66055:687-1394(+)